MQRKDKKDGTDYLILAFVAIFVVIVIVHIVLLTL